MRTPVAYACRCRAATPSTRNRTASGVPRGFETPSRKVELYSQTFLDQGYAPLPDFEEPPIGPVSRPDLATRFPLILTSAKATSVLPKPASGAPQPAQACPAPRGGAPPRSGRGTRGCQWRLGGDRDTGRERAGPRPAQRSARPPCGGGPARVVAGVQGDRCARLRSVRPGRRQSQLGDRVRSARSGERNGIASVLPVPDPDPRPAWHAMPRSMPPKTSR